jgi:hypothetical protein
MCVTSLLMITAKCSELLDDEYARSLEEQWIDSLDNASTASLSQSSTSSSSSVLQGIVIGFFFPILPFFFMRNQPAAVFWEDGTIHDTTPNVILSCVIFNLLFRLY